MPIPMQGDIHQREMSQPHDSLELPRKLHPGPIASNTHKILRLVLNDFDLLLLHPDPLKSQF